MSYKTLILLALTTLALGGCISATAGPPGATGATGGAVIIVPPAR